MIHDEAVFLKFSTMSPAGPAPVVCEDLATDCAEKVTRRNAKRKCQFRPKLKEQCPRSCGLCDTP